MVNSVLPAIHPGEILRDLYLEPLDMTPYALAKKLNVPRTRIERIVGEKVGITTDTALCLARFFKTSPELWMNMQTSYDLKTQAQALEAELATIEEYALAG
ncbi:MULTISPECIES: HigA family addiction module antitoxin [unclassified Rhizobium]|uniref:HigA family addiction module antitoxin n=1 Tax=unclassified Rhizobium TaxID=2613769 RepID=UPI001AE70111|nr:MULTISPECIES: HigA family addiction module antitoxin [unclassified Rhizobium]MBP2461901.1 addiction module HigA family antidote [Rhizobium sp. PvP014]MBP2529296.1 addiction module HigA family antidote [Rhizobium sp. PvP099]